MADGGDVVLPLLQLISKLQLLSFSLSSLASISALLLLSFSCLFRFNSAAATRPEVAPCCSLANGKKALMLSQRGAAGDGRRAWQANMARITDIFDGDIARITGINAQRRQLQQQKELA